MFSINARLVDVNLDPNDLQAKFGFEKGGRTQCFIDQSVIDDTAIYVPASPDRAMEFSAQLSTIIGEGIVVYNTPYAQFQYYGFVMTDELGRTWVGPGEKKPIVTSRPLRYDRAQNELAGAFWFERSKADNLNKWVDGARRVAIQGE